MTANKWSKSQTDVSTAVKAATSALLRLPPKHPLTQRLIYLRDQLKAVRENMVRESDAGN